MCRCGLRSEHLEGTLTKALQSEYNNLYRERGAIIDQLRQMKVDAAEKHRASGTHSHDDAGSRWTTRCALRASNFKPEVSSPSAFRKSASKWNAPTPGESPRERRRREPGAPSCPEAPCPSPGSPWSPWNTPRTPDRGAS